MKNLENNEVILLNSQSMESVMVSDKSEFISACTQAYEKDIFYNVDARLFVQMSCESPVLIYMASWSDKVEDMRLVAMCSADCWMEYGWGKHTIKMSKKGLACGIKVVKA